MRSAESVEALVVEGMALLYTTHHYMEQVEPLCDHIAILDGGRTQAESSRSEAMARSATSASSLEPSRPVVGRDIEIPVLRQVVVRPVTEMASALATAPASVSTSTTRCASRGNGDRQPCASDSGLTRGVINTNLEKRLREPRQLSELD